MEEPSALHRMKETLAPASPPKHGVRMFRWTAVLTIRGVAVGEVTAPGSSGRTNESLCTGR